MKICIIRNINGVYHYASGCEASFFLKLNRINKRRILGLKDKAEFISSVLDRTWTPLPTSGGQVLLCRGIGKTFYLPDEGVLVRLTGRGYEEREPWHPGEESPCFCVYNIDWLLKQLDGIWEYVKSPRY